MLSSMKIELIHNLKSCQTSTPFGDMPPEQMGPTTEAPTSDENGGASIILEKQESYTPLSRAEAAASRSEEEPPTSPDREKSARESPREASANSRHGFVKLTRKLLLQFVLLRKFSSRRQISTTSSESSWAFMGEPVKNERVVEGGASGAVGSLIKVVAEPYCWPHDYQGHKALGELSPDHTALVIIDMQRDFLDYDGYLAQQGVDITATRAIIPNVQSLLHHCRAVNFPIYHTREGHRRGLSTMSSQQQFRSKRANVGALGMGDSGPLGRLLVRGEAGHDIIEELRPFAGDADGVGEEPVIDKPARSAFSYTDFQLLLDVRGVKNLIICGVTTDQCVLSTMRDANDKGFDCLLVEDACWAETPAAHSACIEMVKAEGGILGAVSTTANVLTAIKNCRGKLETMLRQPTSSLPSYVGNGHSLPKSELASADSHGNLSVTINGHSSNVDGSEEKVPRVQVDSI